MRNWPIGLMATMLMVDAACSRDPKSAQIAALEDAYKSGVLSKAEFDAKRAALAASPQIAALEDAYKSGVLSKAEYEAKRAALQGSTDVAVAPAAAPAAALAARVASVTPAEPL